MRRIELTLLFSGLVAFAACSSSSSTKPDGGTAGSGGHAGSTAGSGGSTAGSGGSTAGTGGSTAGTGGSTAGTGGSTAGTGGSTAGTGGSTAGTGGSTAGTGGSAAGADGGAGADGSTTDAGDGGLSLSEQRGQYLVKNVLGCSGCHTPPLAGGGGPDNSKFLSGIDCFGKDGTSCLASANLTNDATGLKSLTDQQIKDAFTKGIDPDKTDAGAAQYLFSNMPYYQFTNLSDTDASAIVAYLRTLTPVVHAAPAGTGTFATRPSAPQWAAVPLTGYPSAAGADGGAPDAGVISTANGKYLASILCSTCHTVNASVDGGATNPIMLDVAKLFQGGKGFTTTVTVPADGGVADAAVDAAADAATDAATTVMVPKSIQSSNLTPDTTGLKTWTAAQIVAAIKTGKDEGNRTICSPMRSLPNISDADAMDIANYLQAIPAVANAITLTCE